MTWEPINLASTEYEREPEPPAYGGLLYRGARHLLIGPPESLKTIVAWTLALEACRTDKELGLLAHLDFEMGPRATRRLLVDLGATLAEIRDVFYVQPDRAPRPDDIERLICEGVALVIIDAAAGAYDVSGLDDNARKDAERFARLWVQPLHARGLTTVLLDHVPKNVDNRGRFAIGSERKTGAADVVLSLDAVKPLTRGADGLVRVTVLKDRSGFLRRPVAAELELHSDPDTHRIDWTWKAPTGKTTDGDGWRPTNLMEKVSRWLESHPDGANRTTIYASVQGKRDYLIVSVDFLLADGHAAETVPGAKGTPIRILKPFRANPSPSSPIVPDRPLEPVSEPSPPSPLSTGGDEGTIARDEGHVA